MLGVHYYCKHLMLLYENILLHENIEMRKCLQYTKGKGWYKRVYPTWHKSFKYNLITYKYIYALKVAWREVHHNVNSDKERSCDFLFSSK